VAVGVRRSYNTIVVYELGKVVPSADIAARLASLVGVGVGDLFVDDPS
jgi:DNA-binding XRE family transcriptional regulator